MYSPQNEGYSIRCSAPCRRPRGKFGSHTGFSLAFPERQMNYEADGLQIRATSSDFKKSGSGPMGTRGLPGSEAKRYNYTKQEDFREVQGCEKKGGKGEPQGFVRRDDVHKDAQNNTKRDGRPYVG